MPLGDRNGLSVHDGGVNSGVPAGSPSSAALQIRSPPPIVPRLSDILTGWRDHGSWEDGVLQRQRRKSLAEASELCRPEFREFVDKPRGGGYVQAEPATDCGVDARRMWGDHRGLEMLRSENWYEVATRGGTGRRTAYVLPGVSIKCRHRDLATNNRAR